jgi:16S rRNA (guanine527-N7)-methyltransferase
MSANNPTLPDFATAQADLAKIGLVDVSRETVDKLLRYLTLLGQWQPKINLVSNSTVKDGWMRHIIDSAQLVPHIDESVKALTDIGSGAGFPALVIAILRPDITVTVVESDTRKCAFMRTVARETGVTLVVDNKRIEDHPWGDVDMITARALASLQLLLTYTHPAATAKLLFLKGERWQEELDQAGDLSMFHVKHWPSATGANAIILSLNPVRN